MLNLEPASVGGGKKANGHKATCACPICKNMKHAKKGGSLKALTPASVGGAKKANGHKATCKCPICINMKHQTASKKNRRVKRGSGSFTPEQTNVERASLNMTEEQYQKNKIQEAKLRKKYKMQDDFRRFYRSDKGRYDINKINRFCNNNPNFESCGVFYSYMRGGNKKRNDKSKKNIRVKRGNLTKRGGKKGKKEADADDTDSESDSESDSDSDVEGPEVQDVVDGVEGPEVEDGVDGLDEVAVNLFQDDEEVPAEPAPAAEASKPAKSQDSAPKGGRKSNGHKQTCKCPICKNMRKSGKKGGDEPEPDIENQLGDEEEGRVKGSMSSQQTPYTVKPAAKSVEPEKTKETVASDDDYDDLDAAEKGEAGNNRVGGSRKSRRGKSKKTKKTRKIRRRR